MSYQVLARKWRPRKFDDLVGQSHVVRALTHALEEDRLHHAYLFSGTRGVGKTTIGRIFAKALNCERGVGANPCGVCSACVAIDEGRFVDMIEVDAASRTKVEDTRELLENVQYRPTVGRYKVYLIDEVHMLSTSSFNALLKTLEEPPEHVKFLLATTDPEKLPVTVLSRCLQFNLRRLTETEIGDQLRLITGQEAITADEQAIAQLARAADGSMRDGLSLLDQAISFGGGELSGEQINDMLGAVARDQVERIARAVIDGDQHAVFTIAKALHDHARDAGQTLDALARFWHEAALAQQGLQADAATAITAIGEQVSPEQLQLFYEITARGRAALSFAPDPQTGLEMTLLRLLVFQPSDGPALPSPTMGDSGSETRAKRPDTRSAVAPSRASPSPQPSASSTTAHGSSAADQAPAVAPAAEPAPAAGDGTTDWPALIERLGLRGPVKELASYSTILIEDGNVIVTTAPSHEALQTERSVEQLRGALGQYFGQQTQVRFRLGQEAVEAPAAKAARVAREHDANRRSAVESDPAVADFRATFDAQVIDPKR